MKNSTLLAANVVILALVILICVFMPPERVSKPLAESPEIHEGTTCLLKAGDIRHYHGQSYIVKKVYWHPDLKIWIADEDLLIEL